jgi:integrase
MKRKRKLEKHPNGQYRVRIRRDGVSKSFFLGRNKKKAEQRIEQIERDISNGRIAFVEQETSQIIQSDGSKDMRIEELALRHLEWVKANRSEGTFHNRHMFVLKFLDFVGGVMVSEINRMTLEDFYADQKTKSRFGNPNAGNEAMSQIKTMLRWADEMEICDLSFRRFPPILHTPPETKRINETDLAKMLANAREDFRDMIVFGLLTGLRPKELIELTQDQVKCSGSGMMYVSIERHKTSRSSGSPKPRSVPLSPNAEEIVERQVRHHPRVPQVFVNGAGTQYTRYGYKCRMKNLCKKADTSRIHTPYSLRHTFASMESDAGVETTALAGLMGHSTVRTLGRYVNNTYEHHRKAVQMVEDRLKKIAS